MSCGCVLPLTSFLWRPLDLRFSQKDDEAAFKASLEPELLRFGSIAGWMITYLKKLARGERTMTDKALRLVNEVPGITSAIIVILVIVKPF